MWIYKTVYLYVKIFIISINSRFFVKNAESM